MSLRRKPVPGELVKVVIVARLVKHDDLNGVYLEPAAIPGYHRYLHGHFVKSVRRVRRWTSYKIVGSPRST